MAMNCDHQNLVIFDERQEKGSAQYVIAEMSPWQRNAFSPNRDMEVAHLVFDKIPSCRRNDFSLGECEPQHEHRSVKLDMLRGQKLHDLSCLAKHDLFISCVDYHKVLLLLACNGSLADRIWKVSNRSDMIMCMALAVGDHPHDFCGIQSWDPEIHKLGNYNIFLKLIVIKVASSSIVVASIYFQLICSIGMRHRELVQKLASPIQRQWDLGIMQLDIMEWMGCGCECCNGSYFWTRCYDVEFKQFLNMTTWGQAVFRGSGNVMTQ